MSYIHYFISIGHIAQLVNKLLLIEEGIKTHETSQHLMYMDTYTMRKTWLNAEFFLSPVLDALS